MAPPSGRSSEAVPDEVDFFRLRAVVVPAVRRELLAAGRIERDVEQVGPVPVSAEHVRRDEARAGEIAFVAEDAVELQRMPDRLVDLQDHLVRRQQDVHRPARAVRCGDELERLLGDPAAGAAEAEALENLVAALLADAAVAVEGTGLRVTVGVRGDRDPWQQEAIALRDVAAGAGDEPVRRRAHFEIGLPVDDARIEAGLSRLVHQQLEPFSA